MEIKTVWELVDNWANFDRRVNTLLADGWGLVKREVLPGEMYGEGAYARRLLYAEMFKPGEEEVKEVEVLPLTWRDAVEMLKETCGTAAACDQSCPMFDWCQLNLPKHGAPANWSDPA